MSQNEIVLVTGGSGCIGQHIIKLLIEKQVELKIKEIRSLDLKEYKNVIGHKESPDFKAFVGDICKTSDIVESAFNGVSTVFHCAGLISLNFPPSLEELNYNNIEGTENIIKLCLKFNIKRLVYSSCGSVNFVPYKNSTFSIIINQTESKATTPICKEGDKPNKFDEQFLIPGYASSKLKAENLVLKTNGTKLDNNTDVLDTVAIRFSIVYGEGDNNFLPPLLQYLATRNNVIPRIGGPGGKHQLVYAGNVAWGHICAFKTLRDSAKKISGLPVFVTDETSVNDYSRFLQRIGKESGNRKMKFEHSKWFLPHILFYFIAFLIETVVKFTYPIFKYRLNYSLRAISSFTSSVIMFNPLRASIHMDYDPLYDPEISVEKSAKWYGEWYNNNIGVSKRLKIDSKHE